MPPVADLPRVAERRHLTALCAELVEAVALAAQLELEDFHDVVRTFHAHCQAVIAQFDGYIAQQLEQGVVVYFGYPQAHDDDAQRAIRAGLQLVETWCSSPFSAALSWEEPLAVRVGIHTGPVVIESRRLIASQEILVVGITATIAARLRDLAAPQTVVISAATAQPAEGYFVWETMGTHALAGQSQPLTVYHVHGASLPQTRLEVTALQGLTPFVGRETDLALLQERWRQVQEGRGQVVLLSGEAGIGKSRLVHVLTECLEEPHIRLDCRCSPYYQHTAWHAIIEMVQRLVPIDADAPPAEHVKQLERFLQQYRLMQGDNLPLIASLLALPLSAERYPPMQLSPQHLQRGFCFARGGNDTTSSP